MIRGTSPLTALAVGTSVLLSGCSDLPPGQTGIYGDNGAAAGGRMAQAATMTSAESIATGSTAGLMVNSLIVIIAKHQATAHQRRVAKANAYVALAKIHHREKPFAGAAPHHHRGKAPGVASTPERERERGMVSEAHPAAAAKKPSPDRVNTPRYIAVDTERDERTAPQAKKSVVIFDTATEEIVGNNVYDVKSTPPIGATARFETYTAEYVGSGL